MFAGPCLPMPTNAVCSCASLPKKQRPRMGAVEFKSRRPDSMYLEASSAILLAMLFVSDRDQPEYQ